MSFLVRFLFELILFSVFPRRVPCSRVEEAKELTPWSKDHSCLPAQPAGDFRAFFLSYFFGFMQSWLASDLGRPGSKEMDLASLFFSHGPRVSHSMEDGDLAIFAFIIYHRNSELKKWKRDLNIIF